MEDTYPKFKAAAVQASPVYLNRKGTIEKACQLMMAASKNGAKLVAFPETYVPGYPHWIQLDVPSANYPFFKRLFEQAVVIPSAATEELCRGAREADVYVVIGVNEKASTQMGTMWNTNLLIDNRGRILGKHRKIVPTFAEKMVWSRGDGSGLRVWETDLGRIGTLICGNNTHSLYKYALIAQGEQVHVANYPSSRPPQADIRIWNRIRSGAHSLEGKLFTITSSSTINSEMVEILCGDDQKKRKYLASLNSYSAVHNPLGNTLAEVEDKDEIIYADIDISEMITAKQYHDIIGHYTRMDVVSLNLCQDEDQPIWYFTRMKKGTTGEKADPDLLNNLLQTQQSLMEEVRRLTDLVSANISASKKK